MALSIELNKCMKQNLKKSEKEEKDQDEDAKMDKAQ